MLRASQKNGITSILNNSNFFDSNDFEWVENKNNVQIKYKYSEKTYLFSFNIPEKETVIPSQSTFNIPLLNKETVDFIFIGYMRPGKISDIENFSLVGLQELHKKIETWLLELDDELIDLRLLKKINKTEEKVEEFFSKVNEITEKMEDSFFTKEEAEDLRDKLNNMEKNIIENLEKTINDKTNLEKEIRELKKEIEKLKMSTEKISKKHWAKKCFNKLGEWATNPEKRKLFLYGIKFIGGATKLMGIETQVNIDKDIIDLLPKNLQDVIPDNLIEINDKK